MTGEMACGDVEGGACGDDEVGACGDDGGGACGNDEGGSWGNYEEGHPPKNPLIKNNTWQTLVITNIKNNPV